MICQHCARQPGKKRTLTGCIMVLCDDCYKALREVVYGQA